MSQINLLNINKKNLYPDQILALWAVRIFATILILMFLYYGYLWFAVKSTADKILMLQDQINADQKSVLANPDRAELLVRQAQLRDVAGLVTKHLYWSRMFPELASVTLKTAAYSSLNIAGDSTATMSVIVPTYTELDRFLQIFDLPEVNKNFSNLKIVSISKTQTINGLQINARISMKYNPEFMKNSITKQPVPGSAQ